MKKFYQKAEAGTAPGGYVVRLDGKLLKTPLQHPIILPSAELAKAIAAEWDAQKENIVPGSMPLMQLVNTMLDKASGPDRTVLEAEALKYAGSDLLCYYATHPRDLVARQEKYWQPLLAWIRNEYGIVLETVSGIKYQNQPPESLQAFSKLIKKLDAADFTIVQAATPLFGSLVTAFALLHRKIDAEETFQAACVDEIYQLEKWGEDAPARRKLDHIRREIDSLILFRDLVKASS